LPGLRTILVKYHISDPMGFVLDMPVLTSKGEQPRGIRFSGGQTGNPIDGLGGDLASFLLNHAPLHAKDLLHPRKVYIVIE